MEAVFQPEQGDDSLLAMVDFKWLMAGLGWRVDLTRLRRDAAYLGQCARLGLDSESPWLRRRSAELLNRHTEFSRHLNERQAPGLES
jgi:hypothetical protein